MSSALGIIAMITALGATICAFIFIVPEKKRSTENKFLQIVHDLLNFKMLIIEKVLQAIYIYCTAFVFIEGFFMLFQTEPWSGDWLGGQGLLIMILGPVAVRLAYEMILLIVLLVKNVIQINNKLKNQNEGEASDGFTLPKFERAPKAPKYAPQQQYVPQQQYIPQAPQAPQAAPQFVTAFCTECGSRVNPDGSCPNCGR